MPIATPQGTLDFKSVDKVTFVGASSNTVIDTTTGSLGVGVGVGGPTSNLHVVGHTRLEGDINMLHTANTASIKLNSNVVTEFPRSKKLIKYPRVAMTANSSGGYVVDQTNTASHGNADAYAYRLFDNTSEAYQSGSAYSSGNPTASAPTTTASDGSTHHGVAITLDLVTKIRLDHVVITSHSNYGRTPVDGTFLGSNNSSVWDVIQTFSGLSTSADNQKHTIYVTNPSQKLAYRYIRFVITKTHTSPVFNGGSLLEFRETEYYGVPEYDPDAHGTDVTVKSYPNVPNTDWLEVYYDAKNYTNGAVQDETSNNRDATLDGVVHDPVSKSFTFDGGNDKIHMGPFSNFTPTFSYTVSLWFKVPEISSGEDILFHFGHGTGGESFGMNVDNGKLGVFIWDGTSVKTQADIFTATKWVHTTCIANSDGTVEIYFNGRLVLSGDTGQALTIPTNPYLSLGIHFSGEQTSFQSGGFFKGSIANFRLFNRALTSDEIYQLYAYQKEYFGHGDLSMTLKAGRLGIGTSEPRGALDVRGDVHISGSLRKTRALMFRRNSGSYTYTTQTTFQTIVDYGPPWVAYSTNPLYNISHTGDYTDSNYHHLYLRIAIKNESTGEVVYFPDSTGWRYYIHTTHQRLDEHSYQGILSGLTIGNSYTTSYEIKPRGVSSYKWQSQYGDITGIVWD